MNDVRGTRIVALLEDPDVTGDLLLVGVALAAKYDFGWHVSKFDGVAPRLWPWPAHTGAARLKMALREDIRTYKPVVPAVRCCTAPMTRRDGNCGRNASSWGHLTDWSTGERFYAGSCSRHKQWFVETTRANWRAKPENPPLPCANHGGALARHFPRLDWGAIWRRIDPRWVEHPEATPWPKPDLCLVFGSGEAEEGAALTPLLSIVPNGNAT